MRGVARRRLFVLIAAMGAIAAVVISSPLEARQSATCTYEQKQGRSQALASYKARMATDRAAYFKTHTSKKQRTAFLKAQQKKLKALQATAACSVPPLPPSSSASCSPQFAPGPGTVGLPSEGPMPLALRQSPVGRDDAVILFIDYPDSPGLPGAPEGLAKFIAPDPTWFDEVSNGRFSVTVTPVTRWFACRRPCRRTYRFTRTGCRTRRTRFGPPTPSWTSPSTSM